MNYHVEVNTVSDKPNVWTGNRVDHETKAAAIEAARELFHSWMAVKDWRVVDDGGVVVSSSL